jgi:hypothetical protein
VLRATTGKAPGLRPGYDSTARSPVSTAWSGALEDVDGAFLPFAMLFLGVRISDG